MKERSDTIFSDAGSVTSMSKGLTVAAMQPD